MDINLIAQFVFYTVLVLCFSDLAFFIIRKVIRFSESLINTKFNFGKIKTTKGD